LLLGQTRAADDEEDSSDYTAPAADQTVLEHVIQSNVARERALQETAKLSKALEDTENPISVVHASRKLKHARLRRDLEEMRRIAARRSGARGAKARKELIALEEKFEASQLLYANIITRGDPQGTWN
jgi:hypothetical protein